MKTEVVADYLQKTATGNARLSADEAKKAADYLKTFGYVGNQVTEQTLELAVVQAQEILEVKGDGVVGPVTLKAMEVTPRCGLPDIQFSRDTLNQWLRSKAKAGISYHIRGYVKGLTSERQEQLLINAWESWEKVCNLRIIRKKSDSADIIIDASARRDEEFGTAGNVLAWAELPFGNTFAGKLLMKFDLAETWIDDPTKRGILFQNVACHEFGHILGLDHTDVHNELMFPTYAHMINSPQAQYDVPQVLLRYPFDAGNPAPVPTPTPPPTAPGDINRIRVLLDNKPYKLVPE